MSRATEGKVGLRSIKPLMRHVTINLHGIVSGKCRAVGGEQAGSGIVAGEAGMSGRVIEQWSTKTKKSTVGFPPTVDEPPNALFSSIRSTIQHTTIHACQAGSKLPIPPSKLDKLPSYSTGPPPASGTGFTVAHWNSNQQEQGYLLRHFRSPPFPPPHGLWAKSDSYTTNPQ
ncbi:hypothetical protein BDP27DRAFT_1512196 [Rhodocollybia butyracea]|uniref:Uncharacterized protein n=1 Tax=Rhodocollybia butyracea TaxID=206335 RepID=A0A9P5PUH7_9AGAR|nr:hypothetical protein BDP27DRAFT_1512196 [Rhodocollybia butyracea]